MLAAITHDGSYRHGIAPVTAARLRKRHDKGRAIDDARKGD
jgi:hypothetical protein